MRPRVGSSRPLMSPEPSRSSCPLMSLESSESPRPLTASRPLALGAIFAFITTAVIAVFGVHTANAGMTRQLAGNGTEPVTQAVQPADPAVLTTASAAPTLASADEGSQVVPPAITPGKVEPHSGPLADGEPTSVLNQLNAGVVSLVRGRAPPS